MQGKKCSKTTPPFQIHLVFPQTYFTVNHKKRITTHVKVKFENFLSYPWVSTTPVVDGGFCSNKHFPETVRLPWRHSPRSPRYNGLITHLQQPRATSTGNTTRCSCSSRASSQIKTNSVLPKPGVALQKPTHWKVFREVETNKVPFKKTERFGHPSSLCWTALSSVRSSLNPINPNLMLT